MLRLSFERLVYFFHQELTFRLLEEIEQNSDIVCEALIIFLRPIATFHIKRHEMSCTWIHSMRPFVFCRRLIFLYVVKSCPICLKSYTMFSTKAGHLVGNIFLSLWQILELFTTYKNMSRLRKTKSALEWILTLKLFVFVY